jgi:hypothetical protein
VAIQLFYGYARSQTYVLISIIAYNIQTTKL